MYNVIMHHLNSFLSCSIKNFTLSSSSRLFTIKIGVFSRFISFNSHSGLFHEAITKNSKLHDFLINSRYSCKKYCSQNSTI